jgi:hypothetical protein
LGARDSPFLGLTDSPPWIHAILVTMKEGISLLVPSTISRTTLVLSAGCSFAVLHGDRRRHRLHFDGVILAEQLCSKGLADVVAIVQGGLLLLR